MKTLSGAAVFTLLALFTVIQGICPGQNFPRLPVDPKARGPWPVGERTVVITERNLTVEIWYPATIGSEVGKETIVYSLRDDGFIPLFQARKIPDELNPFQPIDAYRDLPLDISYGPYPVHLHIHGTAAFRTASAHQMTHFASRGFIVVSADHPGICLHDMLGFQFGGVDQEGDARLILDELRSLADPQLSFLRGHMDISRISLSGHSAGGGAVRGMADVGNVIIPWAAFGVMDGPALQSSAIIGGVEDGIANYENQVAGYENAPIPKRLVGIARAGHMVCTDLCWIGKEHGGIVEIGKQSGIYLAYLFAPLGEDGCDEDQVKDELAWEIMNYATAAAQEEILLCEPTMAIALRNINSTFVDIFEYREQLN